MLWDVALEVITSGIQVRVQGGSPSRSIDRTFRAEFEFHDFKCAERLKVNEPARQYRNPLYLAQEWRKALSNGDCSSQASLARSLGLSRARVTQGLRLLRLAPDVLKAALAALGDPLPSRILTERMLRPIVNLSPRAQKRWLENARENLCPGSSNSVMENPRHTSSKKRQYNQKRQKHHPRAS